jgi:CheY-like chemotaxis protein
MNLDFGILWIEDSFSKEEEENLRRRVREAGFIARIETVPNSKSISMLAREHSLYHIYDIILLDYRLEDENGDVVAPKIRELFPSTTILFYSGSVEEDELRHMMAVKKVEGVYCSSRRRFIERTGSLIEQTARSLDRLSGMRGLAMRVVAECDDIMKGAVISMSGLDPDGQKSLNKLDTDVFDFISVMKNKYEASLPDGIEGRLKTRVVDSAKLFDHFRRLTKVVTSFPDEFGLDAAQVERLRELRRNTTQYTRDVLQRRNILGHAIEVKGISGWVLTGTTEINVSDFPDIRRLFAVNIDALREMSEILVSKSDY